MWGVVTGVPISFGWDYTPGDIAALSRNVNTRVTKTPPPQPSLLEGVGVAATVVGSAREGGEDVSPAKEKPAPLSSDAGGGGGGGGDLMAAFLPRIRSLNQLDVALYAEARKLYEQKKKAHLATSAAPASNI